MLCFKKHPLFFCSGMQVDLSSDNGAVTKELLNVFNIHPFLKKKGSKGMAERMGCNILFKGGKIDTFCHHIPHVLGCKMSVVFVQKNEFGRRNHFMPVFQIRGKSEIAFPSVKKTIRSLEPFP